LREIQFYAATSPRLAERFDRAVRVAERSAAAAPEAGSPYKRGTRRMLDRVFNFSLVDLYSDSEIQVVAVARTSRRPGYWTTRLGAD